MFCHLSAFSAARDNYCFSRQRFYFSPTRVGWWTTECFGAQEVDVFFLNNIFDLKGNCVLRTLKNSFAIFWAWRTYTHTHIHTRLGQINSLKGSYLKRPKCKPLGNNINWWFNFFDNYLVLSREIRIISDEFWVFQTLEGLISISRDNQKTCSSLFQKARVGKHTI